MKTSTSNTPSRSPDCAKPVVLQIQHDTVYDFSQPASLGYNVAWLRPLENAHQHCERFRLRMEPKPTFVSEHQDAYGNTVTYFELHSPHREFRIRSHSIVTLNSRSYESLGRHPWEEACFGSMSPECQRTLASHFAFPTLATQASQEMLDYARISFSPGRELQEATRDLCQRLYKDFRYKSGATTIDTPLAELWRTREGVCQDFAHLSLAMLRGLGLSACYVSGYLLTHPPKGEKKRLGADASHAWFGVLDASCEWLFLDPTNNLWVNNEHVEVARGRDYFDVPPVKGVSYGGGTDSPEVSVTVQPLVEEE